MRTTSALEGFNSQLNKKFAQQGNFFKFLHRLIEVEFVQSREMHQMVDSGGSARAQCKNKKDDIIRNATQDLDNNKITIIEFLNNVTCAENETVTGMAHYVTPQGYFSDSESDSGSDSETEPTEVEVPAIIQPQLVDLCIICIDRKPNVVFLPCRHLKCCDECSSLLAAQNENQLLCPYCKGPVADTIIVYN